MPDDSTETQPDPRLQEFLDRLSKPAPGHTDPETGIVKPEYEGDEIQNKLQVIVALKDENKPDDERNAWEREGLEKLLKLYPTQREYFKGLFDRNISPRTYRALEPLKPHLDIFDAPKDSE